jgi:hypothetical protein
MSAAYSQHFEVAKNESDTLMNLFRLLGEAYRLLSRFHCKEAHDHFDKKLTKRQRETGWVQG